MRGVSMLGEQSIGLALLFGLALPLWGFGYRRECLLLVSTLVVEVINLPIKELIGRVRPDESLVQVLYQGSTGTSFPSGHAVRFMVFFGALIYMTPNIIRSIIWVRLVRVCLIILILLGGVSRIYLGAHWTSDVAGGYLYGAFYLALIVLADNQFTRKDRGKSNALEELEGT